jgi:hypothetical protein
MREYVPIAAMTVYRSAPGLTPAFCLDGCRGIMSLPCFGVAGEEQITCHHLVQGYTGLNIPGPTNNKLRLCSPQPPMPCAVWLSCHGTRAYAVENCS